jgi:hypothetical protein
MAVRESVETTTQTRTKILRVTEVLVQEQHPDVLATMESLPEPVDLGPPLIELIAPKAIAAPPSPIPADSPELVQELVDLHVQTSADGTELEFDREWERICDIGWELRRHREIKAQVDELLGSWIERNRDKLRHVGLNSAPIRELYSVFHAALFDMSSAAAAKLSREVDEARYGKFCAKCGYREKDCECEKTA